MKVSAMLATLLTCSATAAIVLAAFAVGRPCLRWFTTSQQDQFAVAVWSTSIGLVLWSLALMGLGLLGVLYRPLIGVLTMAAFFIGLGELLSALQARRHGVVIQPDQGEVTHAWSKPFPRPLTAGLLLLTACVVAGSGISALAPPTAGDALYYHLQLPKIFLAEHHLAYLPMHEKSTFPLAVEMWYLWGLAIEGPVTAQMLHWVTGLVAAGASVLLARSLLGDRWAWVVGVVVLCVPGISNQMTAPLNDVALVALTTLALVAWREAVHEQDNPRGFLLAGLMLGAAAGTKYLALIFAAAMSALIVWQLVTQPRQRRVLASGATIVACTALLVGGAWYLRGAYYHGNPVYPFFAQHLGDAAPEVLGASKTPLRWNLLEVLSAPWTLTMQPERFGGRGHQLGGLFLAALPLLVFARRLRGLGALLIISAAYGVLWYALRQNVRFLLPVVPLLSTAVVWVVMETSRMPSFPRCATRGVLAALLVVGALVPLVRARRQAAVVCGLQTRKQYLEQREPTYRTAELTNLLLPADAHILSLDYREFYFKHRVTREKNYRFHHDYLSAIEAKGSVDAPLRKAGFTHLLLAENPDSKGIQFERRLPELVDRQIARETEAGKSTLKTLHDYTYKDIDGVRRRYRLIALR